jgi:AcrR family transcriptional regulator/acyl-coenzyme A thioesterase PaaI-like protein
MVDDSPLSSEKPASGRRSRADRALETRRKLIDAAARVVGAEGYANASVAKITALADIAQGTFYNYFSSQQDLFDSLLPELGGELLDFIRERIAGEADSFRREEIGFRAYFDFLAERPEFYRILNEAEVFAPKAFRDHMANMAEGYMRALTRGQAKGELPGYEPRELEVIVYALLAARNYISYRFVYRDGQRRRLPQWVDRAYLKMVTGGMRAGAGGGRRHNVARPAPPVRETARLRIEASPPGTSRIEADVAEPPGHGRAEAPHALLMELIEAAAERAAASAVRRPVRLQSLATSFPAPATGETLIATAEAVADRDAVHVAVQVRALAQRSRMVASAQAVFSALPGSDNEDTESDDV